MAAGKTYIWGTGRRKTSVARVRLSPGDGKILVNDKPWEIYFPTRDSREAVKQALVAVEATTKYDVDVTVGGGGIESQAGAIRHGVARALVKADATFAPKLRESGFLTRDSRRKERKKYGQRGARARFQFSKR